MSGPRFSVVTISFNQAGFLRRAIDSVLGQQGVAVEYIICDPGSTDGSREIVDSYGERIDVRLFERDAGPADGLNKGFARATGDVFAYLNSDDAFLPGAFARVADYLSRHPEVDVVTGHALVVDADDRVLRTVWSEPYRRRMVAFGCAIQIQPSTFIRAEAFRRTPGFNAANRATWDGELLMELHLSGARIAVIDAELSVYRLHEESITASGAMADARRRSLEARFRRLMGRPRRPLDAPVERVLRLWKHLSRPRALVERLRRGPIFMRGIR